MGLRIHFSPNDIARTTVADEPDPLWEVLLSLHLLQNRDGAVVFDRWRQQARTSRQLPRLTALAPPRGYSPDFLTPAEAATGLEAGVAALVHTPKTRLRTELNKLSTKRRLAGWGSDLADGHPKTLDELAVSLRGYYQDAISPHWPTVRAAVATDRASRLNAIHTGGNQRLLATLHPKARWLAPILEIHGRHVTGDLYLNGRGLRIVPSYFCWRAPTVLEDTTLPPVLVYPIDRQPAPTTTIHPNNSPLVALVGATRTEVLIAADGCTTTDLAARVGISPASASYHATILRNAGLLATKRVGSSVQHTRSDLGEALLHQANPRP
ncbi:MAG TPA: helix-turn-helix domain-containing protein [Pseudonocardiaceae bacterium]